MEESRNQLRTAALQRRAAADPAKCRTWSRLAQDQILAHPAYLAAQTIAAYRAIGNEVDTSVIIDHALQHRKRLFIPGSVSQEPGRFVQVFSKEDSSERGAAARVWMSASEFTSAQTDGLLVVVPGVLFDSHGHRLGRGGGWYDRVLHALGSHGVYVGLAYEFQIISRVPAQPWDRRVHFVVTESRVIDCGMQPLREVAR